jgi:hypothetical protein
MPLLPHVSCPLVVLLQQCASGLVTMPPGDNAAFSSQRCRLEFIARIQFPSLALIGTSQSSGGADAVALKDTASDPVGRSTRSAATSVTGCTVTSGAALLRNPAVGSSGSRC